MEVQQVLHMNGGEGETSYAFNSSLQRAVIGMVKPIIEKTILDMCCTVFPPECLCIADLGCSSGPNTLLVVSQILDTTTKACRSLNRLSPGFQVFLNDLPGNDFNTIFKSLPDFYNKLKKQNNGGESRPNCFITGTPGSFYDRLFPDKSIHFIHSSYSLHFLSQVPRGLGTEDNGPALNNGNIYLSRTSPPSACMAYKEQFVKDFSLFLNLRSKEMIPGGRAVLTFMGRRTDDSSLDENCTPWTMLALALNDMVSEGLIEEAKVGSFNLPYYAACTQEVRDIIEGEGSFNLDRLDTFEVSWDANVVSNFDNNKIKSMISSKMDKQSRAISISNAIRSVAEAMVSSHFGHGIIDDVFNRFKDRVVQLLTKEEPKYFNLVVSMTKK
ncbi:hypothetical protein Scep_000661 [Stephania cephalantha]|uniref:Uncharacterized protein n=1 Tax=Stephania cephalantha TaxID=152367 RepID=A0AAP0L7J4_9MAGN